MVTESRLGRNRGKRKDRLRSPVSDNPTAILLLIGIRAKAQWRSLGDENLLLVPSLNAEPAWIDAVVQMVRST